MITIISGTNRPGSNTQKVASNYQRLFAEKGIKTNLLSLNEHDVCYKNEAFFALEKEYLVPAEKFIFILPEYNGSFPGIVKLMIDNSDVSKCWHHKKALLTGVSSGRAGNLRGMEHFTGSLLHMKMIVHPNRLPISSVDKIFNEHAQIIDAVTVEGIEKQIEEFIKF
jgi:NAD(P)H-dependent FMN reductase